MGWQGIGIITGHSRPPQGLQVPVMLPSPGWTGLAGSGFAIVPTDPVRVTAKPAVRLLVPDFQRFTDTLDIGVLAFANDGGTLIGGIDRVRFHFEGQSTDVVEPTLRSFADAKGALHVRFGYWAKLRKPASVTGEAHLYVEAIPADATMQSRVIGPYTFSPVDKMFDYDIEVAATPGEISGRRYKTLQAAFAYLTNLGSSSARPASSRVTITEAGSYEGVVVTGLGFTTNPRGRIYLEADAPVTIRFTSYADDANSNKFDTRHPIWVRGANITFDMRNINVFEHDASGGACTSGSVFDGCRFIVSGAGRAEYWRAGARPATGLTSLQPAWFLECETDGVTTPLINARLVRGGTAARGCGDVCTNSECVVGHVTRDWNAFAEWAVMVPALTVTGPADSTLSLSGGSDAAARLLTARVAGSTVGTFTVGNTFALWQQASTTAYNPVAAGQGYFVKDVAAWLNSLPGWSAALLDNSRRASAFARTGTKGAAFSNVAVSAGFTLNTFFDLHDDWYQLNNTGPSNVILFGNRGTALSTQNLILNGSGGVRDLVAVNNAWMNLLTDPTSTRLSQSSAAHSHVVIAHNSMPAQGIRMNVTSSGYNADRYCLIANNAIRSIVWDGTPDEDMRVADNAIDAGFAAPNGATGTIIGGDYASKFVDPVAGNFAPAGVLSGSLKAPVVLLDFEFAQRKATAAIGAFANP